MAARKLTPEIEAEIVRRYAVGDISQRALAGEHGISQPVVSKGYPRGEYRVLCFNCNFGAHLNGGECGCGLLVARPKAVLREVI